MKLALTSDTHYGHSKNTHRIHEKWLAKLAQDIKENDVKALIHAGDWSSSKQDQLKRTLLMFRRYLPDIPIVGVLGNHCLWDNVKHPKYRTFDLMNAVHKKWFADANISHLQDGAVVIGDVAIVGYNGWYHLSSPPTWDNERIPFKDIGGMETMKYLSNYAHRQLNDVMDFNCDPYRKVICVTHMPPFTENMMYLPYCANPRYFAPIREKFDALCVGHSHKYWNEEQDGCLILNCGSDYDKPKHIIFEV